MDRVLSDRSTAAISLATLYAFISDTFGDNVTILANAIEICSFVSGVAFYNLLIEAGRITIHDTPLMDFVTLASEVIKNETGSYLALIVDVLLGIVLGNIIAILLRR